MDQTVLSLDQNLLEGLENTTQMKKITLRTIYIKMCCLLLNFLNALEIENSMSLWWNLIKILYGQYGSNHVCIVSWSEFARNIVKFNTDRSMCDFDKDWPKFTKWTTWINMYYPWLKFFKNISSSKKELSMETYVEYSKGNMVHWLTWFKHLLDQNLLQTLQKSTQIELYVILIKINQSLLNGHYRSTHIVPG